MLEAYDTLSFLAGTTTRIGLGAMVSAISYRAPALLIKAVTTLADTLALARHMWTGLPGPFTGKRLTVPDPQCVPGPVRRGGVPVLVGGAGERRTLRLVAEYADACNLFDVPDEGVTLRRKLHVLREHCDDVGRDYGAIEKTVSTRLGAEETADQFAGRCARLAGWGLSHAVVITPGPWTARRLATLTSAARLVADA